MPFADELLGRPQARALVAAVATAAPDLPLVSLRAAADGLDDLALGRRSDLLRDALLADVPGTYVDLEAVVRGTTAAGDLEGWAVWPVASALAARALEDPEAPTGGGPDGGVAAYDAALAMLAELTHLLTAEFSIRVLLRHDLDRALAAVLSWTTSPDEHVRRLASEGTRSYLPWATRVPALLARPEATLPILEALHRDPSAYVRRSVANHLNDLSRQHGDLVVATAGRWLADPGPHTADLVRHALRTLVKRGAPGALALLGYGGSALAVGALELDTAEVPFGGEIGFSATVTNDGDEPARVAIDYVVHHQKANGTLTPKTFKLASPTLAPGETFVVRRVHSFRPITTRRYHPGPHAVELQVNGVASGRTELLLLPETPDAAAPPPPPPPPQPSSSR